MLAIHPLAERLPVMPDDEFRELVESIREHGLKESLWLYEGQVLDGRHRARACDELGIEPSCREYEGTEPAGFVIDANVHRRHLTPAQLAAIALDFMPQLQAEAKARMVTAGREGGEISGRGREKGSGQQAHPLSDESSRGERARDIAAARVGASPKSVQRAKRVQEYAPDLLPALHAGTTSLAAAEREAAERQNIKSMSETDRARSGMGSREAKQQARMLEQITERCRHISDIGPHVNYPQISELPEEERQKWLQQLRETRTVLSRLIGAL